MCARARVRIVVEEPLARLGLLYLFKVGGNFALKSSAFQNDYLDVLLCERRGLHEGD